MQPGEVEIRGKVYQTVALRVQKFREKYPIESGWGLVCQPPLFDGDSVLIRCEVIDPAGKVVGVGTAEENRTASQINRTSAVENCETSAIGRALASCGFGGTEYATANEMQNAIHQQAQPPKDPSKIHGVTTGAKISQEYDEFREWLKTEVGEEDGKKLIHEIATKCFKNAAEMTACNNRSKFEKAAAWVREQMAAQTF